MRVGVIGLGWPGQTHARNASESGLAKVAAFADIDEAKARKAAEEYGGAAYTDYRVMLDRERLDAVFLCTPHFVRLEPIRAIAERGVALFCEKPPAFTLDEARECEAVIRAAGIVNSVGFMYRWAEISDRMRELLAGRPLIACLIRGAWPVIFWEGIPPWLVVKEKSGGPAVEQGVHLIDVARYMTGQDVAEIHAFGANVIAPKSDHLTIEDTVSMNLRFSGGTVGSHLHNWSHTGWVWEVDCIGGGFRLTWDMAHNRLHGTVGSEEIDIKADDECYRAEVEGFLKAAGAGDQSLIRSSYADSVKTLAAMLAANESLDTGRAVTVQSA